MTGLGALFDLGQGWLWHGFLVFLRVSVALALMPGFGEKSLPARVKLVLAIAATLVVAPMVEPFDERPWHLSALVEFMVTETVAGLVFGIGLRIFVMALQIAGAISAQSTSLSQILGNSAEPMPAIGHVLVIAALCLAMMTGLHVKFIAYILQTYVLVPPGRLPSPAMISEWGISQISHAFSLAFQLSAPFVIVSLLYNLALGAINRAMPQLMVSFVGAPAITAAGMILLALLVPAILLVWLEALDLFLRDPTGGA